MMKLFQPYMPVCKKVVERCMPLIKSPKMGDVAATFKSIAEVYVLGGMCREAVVILDIAVSIFNTVTQVDCSVSSGSVTSRGSGRRRD